MDKPFELRYIEAREFLTQAVIGANRNYNVPYIFINTFMQDLARQVAAESQKELDILTQKYNETCIQEKYNEQDNQHTEEDRDDKF